MGEHGPMLQSFAAADTLALIPLPALLAAVLVSAVLVTGAEVKRARLAWWCAGAALLSLALSIFFVAKLSALPDAHRQLSQHLALAARIGSLDAALGFVLDPLVAPLLISVSAIGSAALLALAIGARSCAPSLQRLAGSALLLAGMQALLLASDFFLLLLASSTVVAAGVVVLGRRAVSPAAGAAELVLACAAALLFWLYGGSWRDQRYVPELAPRLVAVQMPAAAGAAHASTAPKGGQLSLRALPGARLAAGAAELCLVDAAGRPGGVGLRARPCREPARSPFARLPVPAAIHDFHVFAGHGTNELVIEKARIEPGREMLLTLLGPTLDFRELAVQLSVTEPAEASMRRAVQRSQLWGLPALSIGMLLVVLAALAKLGTAGQAWFRALPQSQPAVAAFACGLSAVAGVYVLARLGFLLVLTPGIAAVAAVVGCLTMARAAARAAAEKDPSRAAFLVAIAHGGVAFAGAAGGAGTSSVVYLALASCAASAFALALGTAVSGSKKPVQSGTRRPAALRLSALALSAAPVPALAAMLARLSTEAEMEHLPGTVLAGLLAAGSGLISFALWCACHRAALPDEARPDGGRSAGFDAGATLAGALATVTLAFGLIGAYRAGLPDSKLAWLASIGFVLAGFIAARGRRGSKTAKAALPPLLGWLGAAPKKPLLAGQADRIIGAIGTRLARIERIAYAPSSEPERPEARPEDER